MPQDLLDDAEARRQRILERQNAKPESSEEEDPEVRRQRILERKAQQVVEKPVVEEPDDSGKSSDHYDYVERYGTEGSVLQAIDRAANAVRYGIVKGAKSEGRKEPILDQLSEFATGAKQGWNKEKYASVQDVMDEMNKIPHLLPIYENLGKKEGEFEWGDVPDTIRNLTIGAALDPLSVPTGAVLGLAGKGLSGGSKVVGKALANSKSAEFGSLAGPLGNAMTKLSAPQATGMAVGGLVGTQMTPKDGTPGEYLSNAAKGMAVMGGLGVVAPQVGKLVKGSTDSAANWFAKNLKGVKYSNLSEASETVRKAIPKSAGAELDIMQDYNKRMTGLDVDTRLAGAKTFEGLKTEFIARRNMAIEAERAKGLIPKAGSAEYKKWFNQLTDDVAAGMEREGIVSRALATDSAKMVDTYKAQLEHNKWMIDKVNKEVYGQASGQWNKKTGEGIAGILWHVEDLRPLQSLEAMDDAMKAATAASGPLKMAKSLERGTSRADLGVQKSRELYAKQMSWNWLNQEEKKAFRLMAEYRTDPVINSNPFIQGGAKLLGHFDKANAFMKYNMLLPSTTWLKNNYADNVTRAYHQTGILGAMDASTLGAFRKGLLSDIRSVIKGDGAHVLKNKHTQDMLKLGVLDTNFYKEVDTASEQAKYFLRPERIAELKAAEKAGGPLAKGAQAVGKLAFAPFKFVGDKITSPLGQYAEQTARATTYIRTLETIQQDKQLMKMVGGPEFAKKMAAKVVNDTFFDYSDVTEFERMFAKRMVPFYTFFKNNAIYYTQSLQNPRVLGQIATVQRLRQEPGRLPNKEQMEGQPPYSEKAVPQFMGVGPDGRSKFMGNPSDSFSDFLSMFSKGEKNLFVEKMNPLVKTPYELFTNQDTFTGTPMYPSSLEDNQKHIFGAGHGHRAVQHGIRETLGEGDLGAAAEFVAGVSGVKLDKKGNPVATEDSQVLIDRLAPWGLNSMFWPKPLLNQIGGAYGKSEQGKMSKEDMLNNLLNPYQIVPLSPGMMNYQKRTKEEIKTRENEKKYRENQP